MNINVATLCDFVQVRERMLFVSSGGITQIQQPQYPAPMMCMLAASVEVTEVEMWEPVELVAAVEDEDGKLVAEKKVSFQVNAEDLDRGASIQVPVPIDFRRVLLPAPGRYQVRLSLPEFKQEVCLGFRAQIRSHPNN